MEPILNAKPFDILVTNVEKEHGLVKVFGQVDLQTCQVSKAMHVTRPGRLCLQTYLRLLTNISGQWRISWRRGRCLSWVSSRPVSLWWPGDRAGAGSGPRWSAPTPATRGSWSASWTLASPCPSPPPTSELAVMVRYHRCELVSHHL